MSATWYHEYLGKPWEAVPSPPDSYNCGELVRGIFRDQHSIELPAILIENAKNRRQCIEAMKPDVFGFRPLPDTATHRDFDLVLLGRKNQLSHCGVVVNTNEGTRILHCPEAACGVCLDSLLELKMMGFPLVRWFRHGKLSDDSG